MQLRGRAEVMVPVSLAVLKNAMLQDPTGAALSHPTPDKGNKRAHVEQNVSDLLTDENTVLFSHLLSLMLSDSTGYFPLLGRFPRDTFERA